MHTASNEENLQLRKKNCGHTRGRIPQLATTERNHPTGPKFSAKVDQFFAAVDNENAHAPRIQRVQRIQLCESSSIQLGARHKSS